MSLKIILILVVVSIAYLSLTPSDTISIGNDKIGHFIAYAVLTTIIGLIWYPKLKSFGVGVVLAILYGALIEIGQYFIPGRSMSGYDILANSGGVLLGVIITIVFSKSILKLLKAAKII